MDKIKINLDRENLSSEYIHSKQDFKKITNQVQLTHSIAKSTWFYGVVGIASLALIIGFSVINSSNSANDKNTTLKTSNTPKESTKKVAVTTTAAFFASSNTTNTEPKVKKGIKASSKQEVVKHEASKQRNEVVEIVPEQNSQKASETKKVVIETPKVIEKKSLNIIPHINGYYAGDVPLSQLCGKGIEINETIEVKSYLLYYSTLKGDKTIRINGEAFPASICEDIRAFGIDQMIFITEIIGEDEAGIKHQFTSLNLTTYVD